jgi:hypothetical protein
VLDLILTPQSQPEARVLPSRNSRGTLLGELSAYITLVDSNKFDIESAIPLVESVVNKAPDVEIWCAVFELVAKHKPETDNTSNYLREYHLLHPTTIQLCFSEGF